MFRIIQRQRVKRLQLCEQASVFKVAVSLLLEEQT